MGLQLFPVIPALQPYVKVICSMEIGDPSEAPLFRVLPDACVELFISYREAPLAKLAGKSSFDPSRSFAVSRMRNFMDAQMREGSGCIAVCLHPGMAHHFFPLPMNELSDTATELDALWKTGWRELEERVGESGDNDTRVQLIQRFLLRQLKRYGKEEKAFTHCLRQVDFLKGQVAIPQLAREAGLSQRQLGRLFQRQLGMPAKEYARVSRFLHSLENLKKRPGLSLTAIAYESGYYDQAHFIHDCKAYAGLSPKGLLAAGNVLY